MMGRDACAQFVVGARIPVSATTSRLNCFIVNSKLSLRTWICSKLLARVEAKMSTTSGVNKVSVSHWEGLAFYSESKLAQREEGSKDLPSKL